MTDTIQTIHQKVNQYKHVIETQEKDAFYALWAEKYETSLISVNTCFIVSEAIYRDFLIGGIRKAYSKIEFEIKTADVRLLTDDCAVVIFLYEIHCTRRETGEPLRHRRIGDAGVRQRKQRLEARAHAVREGVKPINSKKGVTKRPPYNRVFVIVLDSIRHRCYAGFRGVWRRRRRYIRPYRSTVKTNGRFQEPQKAWYDLHHKRYALAVSELL